MKATDQEEIEFFQKELSELGLDFPEFLLILFLNLHRKYLASKGLGPKDKKFDKILVELKEKFKVLQR